MKIKNVCVDNLPKLLLTLGFNRDIFIHNENGILAALSRGNPQPRAASCMLIYAIIVQALYSSVE